MPEATSPAVAAVPDDETLVGLARQGSSPACQELFRRHRGVAYRVAYRLLGHEADALDAVQEGFIKALTHLHGFQGRSSFKTWLLRVVSNAALDLGRQRGRREALSLDVAPADEAFSPRLLTADESGLGLERADLRMQLDRALQVLSEPQRQTFVLHAEAGLSYREVAEVMDISIGTVMSRLYYARQKLRAYLAERAVL